MLGSLILQPSLCASSTNPGVCRTVSLFMLLALGLVHVFGAVMEAHASGRGMSRLLCLKMRADQLCMLDGTVAEAVHRDVPFQAHRAPSPSMHWWASSVRLEHNLKPPGLAGT